VGQNKGEANENWAMIETLDEQREWVRRNHRNWDLVGKRVVRLATEPGRWDE
jgi:hypothetical protein